MSESYYHILGVPSDADEREVKRAYHRLARELHPDKAGSEQAAREVEQRFAVISKAYNVLKDPALRKEYDNRLASGGNGSEGSKSSTPTQSVMRSASRPSSAKSSGTGTGTSKSASGTAARDPHVARADSAALGAQRASIAQKAYAKGVQLIKLRDYAKAIEFLEAAISNNPGEAQYYASLSMALVNAKKAASKAIEMAERAIELDTYNLDYKMNLAHIYQMIGSKTNAIRMYEEILRWDEKNEAAQQMLRELKKGEGFFARMTEESPLLSSLKRMISKK
jgi:curved DNA-binding protein CbpA